MAVVEKLAGRINAKTRKTGTQSGKMVSLKVTVLSFIRERYRATYVIKTTPAKVEVWNVTPTNGTRIQRLAFAPSMVVPSAIVIIKSRIITGIAIMDNPRK